VEINGPIYRYRSLDGADALKHRLDEMSGKLYLAPLDKLNDPFEAKYRVQLQSPRGSIDYELAMLGLEKLNDDLKKCVIACFSKRFDDLKMWSDYAGGHTGICFEYNSSDFGGKLVEVNYDKEIPFFTDAKQRLTYKLLDYQPEGEIRLILKGTDTYSVKPTAVYLGFRISELHRKSICAKADSFPINIPVMMPDITPSGLIFSENAEIHNNVAINNNVKIGSLIHFGQYDWRVLDVDKAAHRALIITKDVTHVNMPYNEEYKEVTWESCTLRKWLNEDFYRTFDPQEQSRICLTTNENEDNLQYGTKGGNHTQDNIFLLSLSEVAKYFYFGDSGQLRNRPKDASYFYDQYSYAKQAYKLGTSETAWWWLRSPGFDSYCAAYVGNDGNVFVSGIYVYYNYVGGGVRPALWLKLEA